MYTIDPAAKRNWRALRDVFTVEPEGMTVEFDGELVPAIFVTAWSEEELNESVDNLVGAAAVLSGACDLAQVEVAITDVQTREVAIIDNEWVNAILTGIIDNEWVKALLGAFANGATRTQYYVHLAVSA